MGTPTAPRCPAGKYPAGPRRKAGPSRRRAIARGRQWLGEIVYGLGNQRLATGQAPDASDQFDTLPRLSLSPTGQCSGRESTASRLQHRTPATPRLRLASPPVRISGIGSQSRHYSRHGLESLPRFLPHRRLGPIRAGNEILQDGDRRRKVSPETKIACSDPKAPGYRNECRINRHFIPPVSQSRVGKTGWWAHQGSSLGPLLRVS